MIATQGIDAMLSFYRLDRADGCDMDQDGDMLLYEWGFYEYGNDKIFHFSITRQLAFGGYDDDSVWQLTLIAEASHYSIQSPQDMD